MVVTLKQATVNFEETVALHPTNLTVTAGEAVVLCGKSGCGKTTLTRLLNGLIPELFEGELTGQVIVNTMNTQTTPIYELAAIVGSVFQNPKTQFFTIDVRSELVFACENIGLAKEEILKRLADVVNLFDLQDFLEREMFELSGGEKQLVAMASAYMIHPQLLVLDEPSSNLDFYAIEKIKQILLKVKARGCTLIIAEHRLYYLQELADRFVLLDEGTITHDYQCADFLALTTTERQNKGLRTLALATLPNYQQPLAKIKSGNHLTLTNLSARYPKNANDAITVSDLTLNSNEVIGIIGHNGAGKSTFAKALTGLLKKKSGSLTLNDQSLSQREQLTLSYLVMQDVNYQLFCETVRKELLLKAGKPEMFEEVVTIFDLTHLLDRHPMSLSGGQKQRVAIATAVLSGKQLIILDEPTSGLDYYHMAQVSRIIRYLNAQSIFVLIISHDIEFIQETCSQLLLIRKGNAKELITLRDHTKSIYTYFQETIA